ncbi:MAG: DUF4838 domain-containing protein [Tannerella sp.]|jgi:hypothetical protein|nr:DUF4838 domain-containing protein [Tannerella sp.]
MKHYYLLSFITLSLLFAGCKQKTAYNANELSYFKMRGIVLSVEDIKTVDWARMAHENGINTIGAHFSTNGFFQTEKGRQFLADCKKYNISVENQQHAMAQLLPRELFSEDSTLFRMDGSGRRVNDCNLCVHSQKALDIVTGNALQSARLSPSGNHRYYFWIDDGMPMCSCPECSAYSDSEQALILENAMIKVLRTFDPEAQLAHLAYHRTIPAPRRVKPEEGIFLEFAPFERTWEKPLSDGQATGRTGISHQSYLQNLKENLTVFPVETAVVLEYWLDVSLFSGWKKPAVKLPWHKEVFESDIALYASLGIRNITSFAVYVDDKYLAGYNNDLQFLKDYGAGLKNFRKKKSHAPASSGKSS